MQEVAVCVCADGDEDLNVACVCEDWEVILRSVGGPSSVGAAVSSVSRGTCAGDDGGGTAKSEGMGGL